MSGQAVTDETGRAPTALLLAGGIIATAAAHGVAAVAGVVPGGWGGVGLGADLVAIAGLAVALSVVLHPGRPTPVSQVTTRVVRALLPGHGPVGPVVAAALALAGLASGLRGAGAGDPWAASDVVLAVLAAGALRSRRSAIAAVAGTELSWAVALLVGCPQVRSPLAHPLLLLALAGPAALLAAAVRQAHARMVAEVAEARRAAGQNAVTDTLTGVTNRRGMELMALPMIEHARRQGEAVHCLFIDLDAFRGVNEALGRGAGDDVLVAVCEAVLASVRATDIVGRWAGDQFVVIGPGTGTSPLEMERRVRSHLADNPPAPSDVWDGDVSIGSATLVPWDEGNIDSLLRRAEEDMRLRRSLRRQSRARTTVTPPTPSR